MTFPACLGTCAAFGLGFRCIWHGSPMGKDVSYCEFQFRCQSPLDVEISLINFALCLFSPCLFVFPILYFSVPQTGCQPVSSYFPFVTSPVTTIPAELISSSEIKTTAASHELQIWEINGEFQVLATTTATGICYQFLSNRNLLPNGPKKKTPD